MIQASHEAEEETAARNPALRQEQAAQRCRVHLQFWGTLRFGNPVATPTIPIMS